MAAARFGFLLLPRFAMGSLAGPLDCLAQANEAANAPLFDVVLLSSDGRPVASESGIQAGPAVALADAPPLDALFVVSDAPLPQSGFEAEVEWLARRMPGTGFWVGGIGTGAWLLARAGLVTGVRVTIPWPYAPLFAETFPAAIVSENLYEIDRCRYTCARGAASTELFLAIVAERHGEALASELIEHFGLEKRRDASERQRVPLAARIGGGQPKLTEAVTLMESNFEEPLPAEEIARLVGISRRQLERLFKQYLDTLPSRYYLELRLNRARQLLQQTSQSILQIGLACGFSSGPHFSSAYRNRFGITPRDQRSRRAGRGGAPQPLEPGSR